MVTHRRPALELPPPRHPVRNDHRSGNCSTAVWAARAQLNRSLQPMHPIRAARWNWPPPRRHFYAGDGIIALAGPNLDRDEVGDINTHFEVFVAAKAPSLLAYLHHIPDVEWENRPPK